MRVGSRTGLRPKPFEVFALGYALAVVAALSALGWPPTARSLRGALGATVTALPIALVAGLVTQAVWQLATRRSLKPWLASVAERSWILLWLRLWLACMVTSYAYFWLKVCVPLVNPASFDAAFWRLDRLLHVGFSPSAVAASALPASAAVTLLDYYYALWLPTLVVGIAFFAASSDDLLRRRVVHSCLLLWAMGAVVYTLAPAVGPALAFPGQFRELSESMPLAVATQQLLFANYEKVLALREGAAVVFDHTLGVAALPSLHVGFHGLFTLWAARQRRALLPVFAAMTALTYVGSVRTGWHYAIDAYLGLALAYAAYRIALRLERAPDA